MCPRVMNKHEKKVSRGENNAIYLNVLILSFDIDFYARRMILGKQSNNNKKTYKTADWSNIFP